jgi:cellulose synthase/poly-beta-1,6-N-acetylglucosamine synthase-like glycosyltransferase
MSILEGVAITSIGLVAYSYAGYPLVLLLLGAFCQCAKDVAFVMKKRDRRQAPPQEWPAVAVIIAAHNEESVIAERIRNLLELDYPPGLLSLYIGSDGSRDATGAILESVRDPRFHARVFERNRGKASVLNDLVAEAHAPIVVFSDANTFFAKDALRALVAPFADARVGGVSGELRLLGTGGDNQDSLYWRLEQMLKFLEGRIGGLLGANGAIYAIRRQLWKPLRADTICDDFCVGMNVSAAGHRLVYEPRAWAEEETPSAISDEYRRRLRIGIGNFQALFRHPEYLWRTSWGTRFAYLSHKVLRWMAPHLLIVGLTASLLLSADPLWRVLFLIQLAGYAAAILLYLASRPGARALPLGPLRIPAFLFALNWAFLVASFRYATGQYSGSWRRTAR